MGEGGQEVETKIRDTEQEGQGCLQINWYKFFQGLASLPAVTDCRVCSWASWANPGFLGPKACITWGILIEKKSENYEKI